MMAAIENNDIQVIARLEAETFSTGRLLRRFAIVFTMNMRKGRSL